MVVGVQQENTYLAVQAKRSAIFDGIGIERLSALFACLGAKRQRLAKGEALMRIGERADRIGVLLSGALSVSTYDLEGRRTIIKRIGPAEIVAAAQSLSGAETMSVDVRTRTATFCSSRPTAFFRPARTPVRSTRGSSAT